MNPCSAPAIISLSTPVHSAAFHTGTPDRDKVLAVSRRSARRTGRQWAGATPSSVAKGAPASVLLCAALAFRRSVPSRKTRPGQRIACMRFRVEHDDSCTLLDNEVAALQREAASLRKSVADLEAENLQQLRLQQERLFKVFDADNSGAVDVRELQVGWKELQGVDLDDIMAKRLLHVHDENQTGLLELEEFDLKSFQATLERLWAEDRAKELAALQEEQERQEKLATEQQVKEYYESLPGNPDIGLAVRCCSALTYLLPFLDSVHHGVPLGIMVPPIMPFFDSWILAWKSVDIIPFGPLIIFVAMQNLAGKQDLPALLRFNLYQAVQLDVVVNITGLLLTLCGPVDPTGWIWVIGSILTFLLCVASITYSVASVSQGVAPRSIYWISEKAEEAMGLKRPDAGPPP